MPRTRTSKSRGRRTDVDSATVATRVAELLRDDIVQGLIEGGERLNEVALAERYGVSRIPLREALRIVEGQGLVEIRPFTGAFVAELSADEIVDIFEIHEALESIAIRLALPCLTAEDLRAAETLARRAEREPDPKQWLELVSELYAIIYGEIGRRHLLDVLRRLVTNQRRYLYAFFSALHARQPNLPKVRDFVAILRTRDIDKVLEFQRQWRRAQREFFIQHMSQGAEPPTDESTPKKRRRSQKKKA